MDAPIIPAPAITTRSDFANPLTIDADSNPQSSVGACANYTVLMATQAQQQPPPSVVLNQMVTAPWLTQCIHVAAELGIADLVKDGPRSVEDLASATSTDASALHRVMRALASAGIFRETDAGFVQTPISECLVTAPGSMRAWAAMGGAPWCWEMRGDLLNTVRTGQDHISRVQGMSTFEYLASMPAACEQFNQAMTGFSKAEIGAVLEAYDFSGIRTLADIGGGHGSLLSAVLTKFPAMHGILFDLPDVVKGADFGNAASRCRVLSGSFFESIPAGADACMMKHIIHDWDDAKALTILRNTHRALPSGGKLLVLDFVIGAPNEPDPAKFLDIEMLLVGGRERTDPEFRALYDHAGFELTRIVRTHAPICIIEGVKP
jgi:hypothetical protein